MKTRNANWLIGAGTGIVWTVILDLYLGQYLKILLIPLAVLMAGVGMVFNDRP